jgi:hypothetical protein
VRLLNDFTEKEGEDDQECLEDITGIFQANPQEKGLQSQINRQLGRPAEGRNHVDYKLQSNRESRKHHSLLLRNNKHRRDGEHNVS